jgi:1-hydroxycarotenoid 3,4-desaturase
LFDAARSPSTPLRDTRVVVVGAGVGGLVSALLLACKGLHVTVVEAAATPGGKMRQVQVGDPNNGGAAIDAGPTVFTMRWVFDQIFAAAGTSLEAQVQLQPLKVLARHAWRGSPQPLDLLADKAASVDAISQFAGPAEGRRYAAFCDEAQRVYNRLQGPHLRSQRPSFLRMVQQLGPGGLATLAGLGPFATLWGRLGHHFHDPRLRQLFGRYATYCGTSPWQAPATLMLVAHVEQTGVWALQGGMYALARALAALVQARGGSFLYGHRCEQIAVAGGRVTAVHLVDPLGQRRVLPTDAVVFNGDASALAQGLLGPDVAHAAPATPVAQRSLSAVTWAVHAPTSGFELVRHNVFFDHDYASEFDDVFKHRRLPQQGTVYVCAQDRGDDGLMALPALPSSQSANEPSVAAQAEPTNPPERLLCLVNAPPDGDHSGDHRPLSDLEIDRCHTRSLALLRHCGLHLAPQAHQMQTTTPVGFNRLFPGTGGALYGPASQGWMSVFKRPGSSTPVAGLFLAGGSTHPGPGVPMAALSGSLAAETLLAHLSLTKKSHPGATFGGTSTPSATVADTA